MPLDASQTVEFLKRIQVALKFNREIKGLSIDVNFAGTPQVTAVFDLTGDDIPRLTANLKTYHLVETQTEPPDDVPTERRQQD